MDYTVTFTLGIQDGEASGSKAFSMTPTHIKVDLGDSIDDWDIGVNGVDGKNLDNIED